MKRRIIFGCALACGAIAAFGAAPYALTVERLSDPCGVDAAAPRFGWKMAAKHGVMDVTQSAYRVLVATSREKLAADDGDLWDSGKVPGAQAIDVAYAGKPLASSRRIWWKVRTWDGKDVASDWSLPGQWVTGIMPPDGWKAKWIGPAPETRPDVDLSGAQWITAPKGKKGKVALQYKFTFAGAKPGEYVEMVHAAVPQHVVRVNGKSCHLHSGHIHNWRYLRFRDITPIGSLQELKYLEIFQTNPADISPLLNCKKLEQLNMCYCFGFDISPLKEMKQLKRLWYAGLGPYRGAELIEALPDTQVYCPISDPDGSTGGGWREDEAYYEMRDVFAMYYQPGGTGVHH